MIADKPYDRKAQLSLWLSTAQFRLHCHAGATHLSEAEHERQRLQIEREVIFLTEELAETPDGAPPYVPAGWLGEPEDAGARWLDEASKRWESEAG